MTGLGGDEFDELVTAATGWSLAAVLAEVDIQTLPTHDLVTAAQACERLKAHTEALQLRLFAELAARPEYAACSFPADPGGRAHTHRAVDAAGDEVSLALSWSPGRAKHAVAVAAELVDDLPDTLAALDDGRLDVEKARLIADRTRCLPDVAARRHVEAALLPAAAELTRAQLDRRLRREVIAAAPDDAERRRRAAHLERHVSRPQATSLGADDGMACLVVAGPAEDVTAVWTAIDAAARHAKATANDDRTLDQLRFDTLAGLAWSGLDLQHLGCCNDTCVNAHQLGRKHSKAATVHVTVAVSTLFGADENPAWLEGFGPITAEAARRISAEGPWRRLLTDPATGELLEYGRSTYSPPPELATFVVARDRTCRFPTCDHPANETDLDHKRPYDEGGDTGATNTWALHRGHHLGKTHHGMSITTRPDGRAWWTTPAGHAYPARKETIDPAWQAPDSRPPPDPDPPPF